MPVDENADLIPLSPEWRTKRARVKRSLKKLGMSYDALLDTCAGVMLFCTSALDKNEALVKELKQGVAHIEALIALDRQGQAYASEYVAMLEGLPNVIVDSFKKGLKQGKAIAPKKGAAKRHEENRAMKADVFSWLDANMTNFKSMDKAAQAIADKVAPIAFRTARDWVGEWKKLRSASKA